MQTQYRVIPTLSHESFSHEIFPNLQYFVSADSKTKQWSLCLQSSQPETEVGNSISQILQWIAIVMCSGSKVDLK